MQTTITTIIITAATLRPTIRLVLLFFSSLVSYSSPELGFSGLGDGSRFESGAGFGSEFGFGSGLGFGFGSVGLNNLLS